jgi:hypothetical protein
MEALGDLFVHVLLQHVWFVNVINILVLFHLSEFSLLISLHSALSSV